MSRLSRPRPRPRTRRDLALPALLVLVFLTSVADTAFTPLLPGYGTSLGLSEPQTGMLLAATTLGMLVLAIPVGLLVVSAAGQAAADDFVTILAARAVFGIAFCIVWTVGPTVILASEARSGGMGRTIAAAGLGALVGPSFSGLTAEAAGPWLPFLVIGVLALPLAVLLHRLPDTRSAPEAGAGVLATVDAMRRERRVVGAVLVVALLGFASSVTNLAVPLRLRDQGLTPASIGMLLTAAAVVWVVAAPLAGRVRERRVGTVLVGVSTVVLGLIWLLPFGSPSTLATVGFLVLSAACRAPLNTFVFVFGRRATTGRTVGAGSFVGVMNLAWAAAAVTGPVLAGAALQSGGTRWPYVIVAAPALLVGAWLALATRPRFPGPILAR